MTISIFWGHTESILRVYPFLAKGLLKMRKALSEIKRKSLRPMHKTLNFVFQISIGCSSFFKSVRLVDVVATICLGYVHTALKHQAPLHLLLPLMQTKSNSKPKIEDPMYPTERGNSLSVLQVLMIRHALWFHRIRDVGYGIR